MSMKDFTPEVDAFVGALCEFLTRAAEDSGGIGRERQISLWGPGAELLEVIKLAIQPKDPLKAGEPYSGDPVLETCGISASALEDPPKGEMKPCPFCGEATDLELFSAEDIFVKCNHCYAYVWSNRPGGVSAPAQEAPPKGGPTASASGEQAGVGEEKPLNLYEELGTVNDSLWNLLAGMKAHHDELVDLFDQNKLPPGWEMIEERCGRLVTAAGCSIDQFQLVLRRLRTSAAR